ncbi:MAG TPA: farnesyl diphosphate synthase [Bacillales bacterium]|nr:farnesyl diphosphate synthase [Bacillales bacterium]
MTASDLQVYFQKKQQVVDTCLNERIQRVEAPDRLKEAMLYSVRAGGKRLRPILLLATIEAFGYNSAPGVSVASAIEMIHTYSLIHDDLPAMDDDDLRRGRPTNHKVFGEAMAILAGDALLTLSFEVLGEIDHSQVSDAVKSELVTKLARAAGAGGMVGGQSDDLMAEGKALSSDELEMIHRLKTGKLLGFSVEAGALLAGADSKQQQMLEQFSKHLGLAFQIRDDILDVEGSTEMLGKTAGSDENKQKSTYPRLLTLKGAKKKLAYHLNEAKQCLFEADIDHGRLQQIAEYIVERNH